MNDTNQSQALLSMAVKRAIHSAGLEHERAVQRACDESRGVCKALLALELVDAPTIRSALDAIAAAERSWEVRQKAFLHWLAINAPHITVAQRVDWYSLFMSQHGWLRYEFIDPDDPFGIPECHWYPSPTAKLESEDSDSRARVDRSIAALHLVQ